MNRLTRHIGLVLISSSLGLLGCSPPEEPEGRDGNDWKGIGEADPQDPNAQGWTGGSTSHPGYSGGYYHGGRYYGGWGAGGSGPGSPGGGNSGFAHSPGGSARGGFGGAAHAGGS
ncbi:MAG: hypothetical protein ABSG86_23305 [Thermoguttaceae bacterium]